MTHAFFSTIPQAIADIKAGKMIVVVDDEHRENEGDLVIAAEKVTSQAINFMAMHGRGLICMPMAGEYCDKLQLPMMPTRNISKHYCAFTVSIEAAHGVTTGISAADRAHTIQTAIADDVTPDDICLPGHIFPLRAHPGRVVERQGHTEAAVTLAELAGFKPAGVLCEIIRTDGKMARLPDLYDFCLHHRLSLISIADLVTYVKEHEQPKTVAKVG